MTMRLITEFDNVTGREDRKQRGDRRPIHASKCITEIPNDGTKETDSLHHSTGTRNRSYNGTRETKFTVS